MKIIKIFLIGPVILCSLITSQAQTEKGNFLLGGSSQLNFSSFKHSTEDDGEGSEKTTYYDIYPQIGYFVADGLAIGTELSLSFYKSGDYKSNSCYLGPFIKYYFGKSNFKPFLSGGTEFGRYKSKWEDEDEPEEYTDKTFMYKFGGGVAIFLSEKISLDLGLQYIHEDYKSEDEQDGSTYKSNSNGIDFTVGFSFVL